MAFKDITKTLYPDEQGRATIKIDYKDKIHRYYARERINFDVAEDKKEAWSGVMYPKGTTTLLDEVLEKKGLMQWPKGLALRELFGFYDFVNESGERMVGFSKEVGSLWGSNTLQSLDKEQALPLIQSANTAWQRKQKKGADIGSVVHDAIEHYVKKEDYDIEANYVFSIKESEYESEEAEAKALLEMPFEVEMAKKAFLQFQKWWLTVKPTLLGAEDLIYSKKYNVCGTFDGLLNIEGKGVVLCDWKTSNASKSEQACMPEGITYSYFIQSAIYAMAWMEMGNGNINDLAIVSCRKDGNFTIIYASDLGLSVQDCIDVAESVIKTHKFVVKTKAGLWQHGIDSGAVVIKEKKGKK